MACGRVRLRRKALTDLDGGNGTLVPSAFECSSGIKTMPAKSDCYPTAIRLHGSRSPFFRPSVVTRARNPSITEHVHKTNASHLGLDMHQ